MAWNVMTGEVALRRCRSPAPLDAQGLVGAIAHF
jgi:hypothetical protein